MTICASVKARDGVVLATDSMSQIHGRDAVTGEIGVVQTYSNARKLFQVGNMRIGVMTYGIGNIGNRSMQGLMLDFKPTGVRKTVTDVTRALFDYFKSAYDAEFSSLKPDEQPALGFFVAGYSGGKAFAEEWEFLLPRDNQPKAVRDEKDFGASWRGIDLPFTRLLKGFDPRLRARLKDAGLNDKDIEKALDGFAVSVVYDGMPVQDAIDFAVYILRTTIGLTTFEAGPPSCGGPLQVATILPGAGFEWVTQPSLSVSDA